MINFGIHFETQYRQYYCYVLATDKRNARITLEENYQKYTSFGEAITNIISITEIFDPIIGLRRL